MPLIGYKCEKHGYFERFHSITENYSGTCDKCGKPGIRQWDSPATFRIDFRDGWDSGLGKYVSTKRERENAIAENGLRRVRD